MPVHKIRAMVASGAIAIAVPGSHGKVVDLIIWSLESAEVLQRRLNALRNGASEGVGDAIRSVSVGAATLQTGAVQLVGKLAIGAEEARGIARGAMQRMRSGAISVAPAGVDLLLGLGSLWFQQDSLRKNYATLLNTPGSGNAEALAAVWSSSVGVMGVGVEVVGVGVSALRPDLNVTVQIAGRTKMVMLGIRVAQYGGAIAASANALNALQFYFAANRATSAGDDEAARFYVAAAAVSIVAVVSGVHAALVGGALLGPVGIAVVLGLAAYGVASLATKKKSSPLEIWARRTLYGLPERHRRWKTPFDLDSAIGELNAAVLGVVADVGINFRMERASDIEIAGEACASHGDAASIPMGAYLDYSISLPNYSPESSCYLCSVTVFRPGEREEETIVSIGNVSGFEGPAFPRSTGSRDYHPKTIKPIVYFDNDRLSLIIRGAIALHANHGIYAVKLELSYWPDKSDKLGVSKIIRMHDKMDAPENE